MTHPHTDIEFLSEITGGKKIPISELSTYLKEFLSDSANMDAIHNPGATTSVLYSGLVTSDFAAGEKIYSGDIASDLANRSGHQIGLLDDTKTGKLLGGLFDHLQAGTLEGVYGDYLDVSDLNPEKVGDAIYASFRPASAAYAENLRGHIITITPQSNPDAVFGKNEVPQVIDGLGDGVESGRITHINGVEASAFRELSEIKDPEIKRLSYKEAFDQSFSDRLTEAQPDAYRAADGRGGLIAADTKQMQILGAGPEITMKPPNVESMSRVHGAEFAQSASAARTEHVANLIETGKLPQQAANAPATVENLRAIDAGNARLVEANTAGELRGFAADPSGNTSYLVDTAENKIYTLDKGGISHIEPFNSPKEAGHAFGRLMGDAAQAHPEAFKGLPSVHSSLGGLGNHIDDMARPAWRKAIGKFGDEAADLAGKGSKILGPIGVASAGVEVVDLEMKLQNYVDFGLVPKDAMLAYRGILTGHLAQATIDPTLVGGELAIQHAHDEWAKAYNISDDVKEALEPGSLLEDVYDAKMWLDKQAAAAGEAVADYASSRWDNPELIRQDMAQVKDAAQNVGEYVVDKAGGAADAVGDATISAAIAVDNYRQTRWEDPSKIGDDMQAVGESMTNVAKGAWNYLFGEDEPSQLEKNLNGADTGRVSPETTSPGTAAPKTVSFGEAIHQFSADRALLRAADPTGKLVETSLSNHPEAEAMFVRLHKHGMQRLPAQAIEGDTPQARIGNILTQVRAIDKDLTAERSQDLTTDQSQTTIHAPVFTQESAEDHDCGAGL